MASANEYLNLELISTLNFFKSEDEQVSVRLVQIPTRNFTTIFANRDIDFSFRGKWKYSDVHDKGERICIMNSELISILNIVEAKDEQYLSARFA